MISYYEIAIFYFKATTNVCCNLVTSDKYMKQKGANIAVLCPCACKLTQSIAFTEVHSFELAV